MNPRQPNPTLPASPPQRPYISNWENTPAPPLDAKTVYQQGRQEWNERYGDYISRERAWRMTALLSLAVAVICASGMAYLGAQNKLVPYVVEVDKLGTSVAIQRADQAGKADTRIIRSQLARWIESVRNVYQDAGAERSNIQYAYAMMRKSDSAYVALNEFYSHQDPFKRAQSEGVGITVNSVLPISETTWQVQWTETIHSAKGELVSTLPYEANLTVAIDPPTEESVLLQNPMGVYITSFHWTQRI